jgi:hypothetical protein
MKTLVLTGVGLSGAVFSGLAAWTLRVSHANSRNAVHPPRLFYGVDEYWNGDYPEGERQW